MSTRRIAILGAGPAGLTAGYLLTKEKIPVTIFEKDPQYVGGIARTVTYKGYNFDIGGHRFFSKAKEVEDFWTEILPNDMLVRQRLSRIFYKNKFYSYPLKIFEVLCNLGIIESCYCFLSYLKSLLFPIKNVKSFSSWVSNRFGTRLFSIFFKTYTEKIWGMRCDEISSDWAAQRIQNLSFVSAIIKAIFPKNPPKDDKKIIKTLIESFRYPRKGPGMLWEVCANKIREQGGQVLLDSYVTECIYDENTKQWQVSYQDEQKHKYSIIATEIVSSIPLRDLIIHLKPAVSPQTLLAAQKLKYRDFLIVALIMKDRELFKDNWIYIHDPSVDVARIQNFKSWSEEMVPNPQMCCYGMEYFCFEDDKIWSMPDQELIKKASREIVQIGLAHEEDIIDGCVVRQTKAYPVYDEHYKENVEIVRREIEKKYPGLYLVGRNGMHKYNNQDHAIMTAMLSVRNILAGKNEFDVWFVNQDAEYLESGTVGHHSLLTRLREVPQRILRSS